MYVKVCRTCLKQKCVTRNRADSKDVFFLGMFRNSLRQRSSYYCNTTTKPIDYRV